jgi:hypothetical protein
MFIPFQLQHHDGDDDDRYNNNAHYYYYYYSKLLRGTLFTCRGFAVRRDLEGDGCDLLEDTVLTSADVCKS